MLSRGVRVFFGVGIVLLLFVLGLHFLYRFYNAPADAEYDLFNVFAGRSLPRSLLSSSGLCSSITRSREPRPNGTSSSGCCWSRS